MGPSEVLLKQMNLKKAIIQFLANEFHLEPENITEDTSFESDLGVLPTQLPELLRNLQDALNITLTEEQIAGIATVGQLLESIESEDGEEVV